jgi:hypothetical protein
MFKRFVLSLKLLAASLVLAGGLGLATAGAAYAQAPASTVASVSSSRNADCGGLGQAGGSCKGGGAGINHVLKVIINILSAVAAVVAVIMIIIAGFKFTTSGGDPQKVAGAKHALIYAIIGLAVVSLSQIIVHFVIVQTK